MNEDPNDPYRPPQSNLGRGHDPGRRGHPALAIVSGAAADLLGTVLMALIVTTLFATMLTLGGVDPAEIPDRLIASPIYVGVMLILGLALDSVGGYVAARIANHAEYKHALLTALLVVLTGTLLGGEDETGAWPEWLESVGILLAFPAAALGAYVYLKEKHPPVGDDED